MINSENKKKYLQKARKAALAAGEYLSQRTDIVEITEKKHDTKLLADVKAERLISDILGSDFSFLGEENGGEIDATAPNWIVDPLDGTVNYSRDLPLSSVSICLWYNVPVLGVVYDFVRKEMFEGIVGVGAWSNNVPINVSKISQKQQSIALTGFPIGLVEKPDKLSDFVKSIDECKKIRLLGSAALSLAYVACGRADIYHEKNINIWDVAAGLALVKSAGGRYEMSGTNALTVYADNGSLKLR